MPRNLSRSGTVIIIALLATGTGTLACTHARISDRSPSLSKLLGGPYLHQLAEDFSGGNFRENLPLDIKQTLQSWITSLVPHTPAFFANFGKRTHLGEERVFAKSRHGIMLPPQEGSSRYLPNEYDVFDELLARRTFQKEEARGGNFVFVSFVNWFLEDALRSKPGTNGSETLEGSGPLIYGTVYGRTSERMHLLRAHRDGKMRTSVSPLGEEVMLMWKDVENSSDYPHKNTSIFVAGEDEMNSHWGHLFWTNTMTLRHNWICDQLREHSPELTEDDDLYWRARMIQHLINLRMITEDYISGFVSPHLSGKVIWKFDADECTKNKFRSAEGSNVYLEFNHLYRWHALVPDQLAYASKNVPLREIRFTSERFLDVSMQEHLAAFHSSPSGKFGFRQESRHFREVTAATIRDERLHGLRSFNDYLEYHNMDRLASFEDLTSDSELLETLQRLYASVEDLDLYVGLNLQPVASEDDLLPPLMLAMVAEHAFAFLYGGGGPCHSDPRLVSEEYLTSWGYQHVYNSSVSPMHQVFASVGLHVLATHQHPFTSKPGIGAACGKPMCETAFAIWHLPSYVGLNELWAPTLWIDEFQHATLVMLGLLAAVILLVAGPLRQAVQWFRREDRKRMEHIQRFEPILVFNGLVGVVYALQLPAYTATALHILFSCRFDQAVREWWTVAAVMWATHGTLYVLDTAFRLERSFNRMLIVHHFAWFATTMVTFATRDIFSAKLNVLLDYFACFEFGLFLLLAYSKWHARVLTPRARLLAIAAVVLYDVTRVIQTALLLYYFSASFHRMRAHGHLWIFCVQLALCTLLTIAQAYTMLEYAKWGNIWCPKNRPLTRPPGTPEPSETGESSGEGGKPPCCAARTASSSSSSSPAEHLAPPQAPLQGLPAAAELVVAPDGSGRWERC